jgi:hypothetical protein
MGTSLKIFLVNEDDTLRLLSKAKYERLLRCEAEERLPEYAEKRIRCAVVVLETVQRRPIAISRVVYSYLPFDGHGRIDIAERERETKMALDIVPPVNTPNRNGGIIDARYRFAKKRYDREFRWSPSKEIKAAILDKIFGKEIDSLK